MTRQIILLGLVASDTTVPGRKLLLIEGLIIGQFVSWEFLFLSQESIDEIKEDSNSIIRNYFIELTIFIEKIPSATLLLL